MSIVKPPYRKLKLWIIGSVIVLSLYSLVGFLLVPWLITSQTPSLITENLGRQASLKEAKFNPYTLELDLNGFEMLEHDSQPFVSFDHLYVNYGLWDSISKLSVAMQQVLLDKPYGHIDILNKDNFNFSDLSTNTEDEPEIDEESNDGLFPVWLGDLSIKNGSLKFEDHSLKTPFTKELRHLNLHLKGLTTKKDGDTPYHLGLELESGSTINLSGNTTLDPLKAEGDLELTELSMFNIWEYLRDDVDFKMHKGKLDVSAHIVFDGTQTEDTSVDISNGLIALKDFTFSTTSVDSTQLDLANFELKDIGFKLLSKPLKQSISISIPSTNATESKIKIQGNDPLVLDIPQLTLLDTAIDINTDETENTSISIINKQLAISEFNLETSGTRELFVKINEVGFNNFNMNIVSSENSEQAVMKLNNEKISINATTIGSTTDKVALIDVPEINIDNLGVDIQDQTVSIANVTSSQATINNWLAKDGTLNLQALFVGNPQQSTSSTTKAAAEQSTDKGWAVAVNNLALTNYQIDTEDRTTKPSARILLDPVNLTIEQFSTDFSKPFRLALNTVVNKSGNFSTKGTVAIDPLKTNLDIRASKIALNVLQPYINDFAKLKLKNGRFNMNGKLNLASNKKNKPVGSFKGNANIARLHTVNTINKKDFLKWKSLNVNGIAFNFEPMKLAIRDVITDGLYNRVIINKDKTTNLGQIFPSDQSKSDNKKNRNNKPEQTNTNTMPLKIGAVKIKNGSALFSDLSLVLPFALNMSDLNGAIKDISSNKTQTASVRLDGKVNRIAPVVIEGSLKAFDIEDFMDIKLNVQDVDLTAVTPYMAQFAGYSIDKGKIRLNLEYKIKQKQLLAENNVVIDQLTLGDEVESPDAVSLPVKLAIGLLQDQNGVIDLDLPMKGSLDDPEFSIGALIGKVLINLLTKAATSPFSLIAGLAGSENDMNSVAFTRGLSTLDETQLEKLKSISEALQSRPKLKVEIKGVALNQTDRLGLAENKLLSRMQNEKWDDIKGDDNSPTDVALVELSENEKKVMIADYYQDDIPDAKSPETTESETGEEIIPDNYYQMARQALIDQIQIPDLEVQQLAQSRASTIAHQLIQVGGLPANRVFVLKESVQQQTEQGPEETVAVELALSSS